MVVVVVVVKWVHLIKGDVDLLVVISDGEMGVVVVVVMMRMLCWLPHHCPVNGVTRLT